MKCTAMHYSRTTSSTLHCFCWYFYNIWSINISIIFVQYFDTSSLMPLVIKIQIFFLKTKKYFFGNDCCLCSFGKCNTQILFYSFLMILILQLFPQQNFYILHVCTFQVCYQLVKIDEFFSQCLWPEGGQSFYNI